MSRDDALADTVADQARDYYDSGDADNFYYHVWGGEDIHIGLYESSDESILDASHRTVEHIARRIEQRPANTRVLDIGAGYGGAARYLVKQKGFRVTCLNLSTVQNARNRRRNAELGLVDQIEVIDGSFEEIPLADQSVDVVWSQDAILHSGRREQVFREVDRVLRPGGDFVFTDPMQSEEVEETVLAPVLERIHLASMGSFETYRRYAAALEWEEVQIEDLSPQLVNHYSRVKAVLEEREKELEQVCTPGYRERMKTGLTHWVNAGQQNALAWGVLHFRKSA